MSVPTDTDTDTTVAEDTFGRFQLSQDDLSRLESIRSEAEKTESITIDDLVKKVLSALNEAVDKQIELKFFDFNSVEREALGILIASDEAKVYHNKRSEMCVRIHTPGFIERLLNT